VRNDEEVLCLRNRTEDGMAAGAQLWLRMDHTVPLAELCVERDSKGRRNL
jgi:hypothetical protein